MKYYKKQYLNTIDYSSDKYQPCWTCANLFNHCCWVDDRQPIPGWIARPVYISHNGKYANSYKITKCPNYKRKTQ